MMYDTAGGTGHRRPWPRCTPENGGVPAVTHTAKLRSRQRKGIQTTFPQKYPNLVADYIDHERTWSRQVL